MPKTVNPLLRRKSSSPFTNAQRRKPGILRESTHQEKQNAVERLQETGLVPSIAPEGVSQDVASLIRHAQSRMWTEMPERMTGMGSERTAEVLCFRRDLPPIVSLAHLHALSLSTTETEREIASLIVRGKLRKVYIPGRGKGGNAVGEGVVLLEDWIKRAQGQTDLDHSIIERYTRLLGSDSASATISTAEFSNEETKQLVRCGLLTSPAGLTSSLGDLFARPSAAPPGRISVAGTIAAAGSLEAIGGSGAIHESGGSGSVLSTTDRRTVVLPPGYRMTVSLPGTGAYLQLLTEARIHLVSLLKQISPRYREATMEILREKWDGNVLGSTISMAKRARGEWTGVTAGHTKKWKAFYGMDFEWVIAECVGSGLVELFDTSAVGTGVRAR